MKKKLSIRWICVLAAVFSASPALPQSGLIDDTETMRVPPRLLLDETKKFIGRRIMVRNISCVDAPKGGFVCVMLAAGRLLELDAILLGAETSTDIAERLITECKGTANLERPACRFDAVVTPTNADRSIFNAPQGTKPTVVVFSNEIDLYPPGRR